MNKKNIIALFASVLIAMPLTIIAEDVEVYTGRDHSTGARPNVVFVLDTSFNMTYGANRMLIHETYDPDYAYPGDCNEDSLYMVSSATKDSRFNESYRWDGSHNGVCWSRYPFYPVVTETPPGPVVHETIATSSCEAAKADLKSQGWYKGKFEFAIDGNWYRGLNDDVMSSLMEEYQCAADPNAMHTTAKDFFVFSGNYLNWYFVRETRLAVAQRGLKDMIDALPDGGVNVGLMPYSENSLGSRVIFPAVHVADNKEALKTALDFNPPAGGVRSMAGALFEAYNYLAGRKPVIGDWNTPESVASSWLPDHSAYNSPVDLSCQASHVVFISDGLTDPWGNPNENNSAPVANAINALPGFTAAVGACSSSLGLDCSKRIARYMNEQDLNTTLSGQQSVKLHVIGLNIPGSDTYFRDLATAGGGLYVPVGGADTLANAVDSLIEEAIVVNGTFVAPSVSVNAFNRSQHRNELYFAVFEVGNKYRWNGNVKKYQLKEVNGDIEIVDVNGNPAIDSTSGEFTDAARSWWSAGADGNDPVMGGANARLQSWADTNTGRNLWTNVASGLHVITADNTLISTNGHITNAHVDASTNEERTDWLTKLRSDDLRTKFGDPLHSRPVVINYGGTDANPDAVAYFTTNDGFIHAIRPGNNSTSDAAGGYELWGFMPKEMLKKVKSLVSNEVTGKGYGLDSSVVAWVKDEGDPGVINGTDRVYLYFGAGRGGRHYYAMDVTSYSSPKLLWNTAITGGVSGDAFEELGYTTAEPVHATIKLGGSKKQVLILSGGYDPDYDILPTDTDVTASTEDMGRAIYIVDALSGNPLFTISAAGDAELQRPDMVYPIAASVRTLDVDNDGYTDRFYVGDLGGQLWRFDYDNSAGTLNGGVIAELGDGLASGEGTNKRRFFNTPDVVLVADGGSPYYAINIGSGNRSRPVADNDTQDIFFSVRDKFVYSAPNSYAFDYGITVHDLVDVTGDLNANIPANSKGWYLQMNDHEKVLAESITYDHQVVVTTYQPDGAISSNSCRPNLGLGRVYAIDIRNAKPVADLDEDGTYTADDRSKELLRGGIPPQAVVLFPEAANGDAVTFAGTEKVPTKPSPKQVRTYWTDEQNED